MTAENLNLIYSRRNLFWRVGGATLVLLLAYGYFAQSVVFSAVARQRVLEESATYQARVVALEAEYLGLSNQVTVDLAERLGFHDASGQVTFVPALPLAGPALALSSQAQP